MELLVKPVFCGFLAQNMEHRILHHDCLICKSHDLEEVFPIKDHSISGNDFTLVACRNCGFRFTQGIPIAEDLGPYYQSEDYISHSDSSRGLINRLYHLGRNFMLGRKKRLVRRYASNDRVLDIGSGTGYFLHTLKKAGFTVRGVEADRGAREYAREKFGLEVLSTHEYLDSQDETTYGLISMWHVLEHVYEPDEYLQKIHAQLDPAGRALVAVPNFTSVDAQYYGSFWAGYDVPRHFWHFGPPHLRTMAARNGFRVERMIRLPLDPFYVAMLSEKYRGSGSLGLLRACWVGLRAHIRSLIQVERSSSILYVLAPQAEERS